MSIAEERNIDEITSRTNNLVREFWNISDLKLFKNGENVTYTAMLNGHKVYVRITENSRRTIEQIIAELEWVQSISESGLVVAHPIRDTNKLLLNSFELENEIFHLAVFTNADGEEPANSDLDNTFIAQQLGLTIP